MSNPLSRRLLRLAGLLSLLLIAVVVNYLVHDGSDVVNPLAEAAQRTTAMPGARLRIEVKYTVLGRTITGTGGGGFNARTGRSDFNLTVSIPGGPTFWAESVGDDRHVYTRSSQLASTLPRGKVWLGMEPLLGRDPSNSFSYGLGAKGTIEMLRATGSHVEEVDHESVRGLPTTHYKATIDLDRMAQVFADQGEGMLARSYERLAEETPARIPIEVWVDDRGLVRLVRMVSPLSVAEGRGSVDMDLRMEFFDFGVHPRITLPPPGKVFDYTPVLRAQLGLEDGHGFGPVGPPAGTPPLSAATFRRRADAICDRTLVEGRSMLPRVHRLVGRLKLLDRAQLEAGAAKPIYRSIGQWFEGPAMKLWLREFRDLTKLAPPPGDAASYRRFLVLEAAGSEWGLAQARAYRLGYGKVGASNGEAEEKDRRAERHKLAAGLGIEACTKQLTGSNAHSQPA